jgi:hypothetical protein
MTRGKEGRRGISSSNPIPSRGFRGSSSRARTLISWAASALPNEPALAALSRPSPALARHVNPSNILAHDGQTPHAGITHAPWCVFAYEQRQSASKADTRPCATKRPAGTGMVKPIKYERPFRVHDVFVVVPPHYLFCGSSSSMSSTSPWLTFEALAISFTAHPWRASLTII